MLAQAVLAARAPAEGGTRLIEWWSLLSPHAALEVGLSVSTCSRRPCLPLLLRPWLAGRRNLLSPHTLLRRAVPDW